MEPPGAPPASVTLLFRDEALALPAAVTRSDILHAAAARWPGLLGARLLWRGADLPDGPPPPGAPRLLLTGGLPAAAAGRAAAAAAPPRQCQVNADLSR